MLGKFIFLERCRGCHTFIRYGEQKETVCVPCWESIKEEPPIADYCDLSPSLWKPMQVSSGTKYDGLIKTLVYKFKYDDDLLIANDLVELLEVAWHQIAHMVEAEPVLVPIPLHWSRHFKRGYNQAEILSRQLSKVCRLQMDPKVLCRAKATKAHHGLKRAERLLNIQGAFRTNAKRASGKCILLVDDIHTSGATLAEAARSVLDAGSHQVLALTVARATLSDAPQERSYSSATESALSAG